MTFIPRRRDNGQPMCARARLLAALPLIVGGLAGYQSTATALTYNMDSVNTTVVLRYADGSSQSFPVSNNVTQFFSVDPEACSAPVIPFVTCTSDSITLVTVNIVGTTISTGATPDSGGFSRGLDLIVGDAVLTWTADCTPGGCGPTFTFGGVQFKLLQDTIVAEGPQSTLGPCVDLESCMTSLGFLNEALLDGTWSGEVTKKFIAIAGRDGRQPAATELTVSAGLAEVNVIDDTDGDGVADSDDNCTTVANADQRDTNNDGFGNRCDGDLNDDCIVNPVDLGILKSVFFTNDADADFDGDGVVNAVDLGIFKSLYFQSPGPSGVTDDCDGT